MDFLTGTIWAPSAAASVFCGIRAMREFARWEVHRRGARPDSRWTIGLVTAVVVQFVALAQATMMPVSRFFSDLLGADSAGAMMALAYLNAVILTMWAALLPAAVGSGLWWLRMRSRARRATQVILSRICMHGKGRKRQGQASF